MDTGTKASSSAAGSAMRSHLTCGGADFRGSAVSSGGSTGVAEAITGVIGSGGNSGGTVGCVACRTPYVPRLGPAPSR